MNREYARYGSVPRSWGPIALFKCQAALLERGRTDIAILEGWSVRHDADQLRARIVCIGWIHR